MSKIAPSVQLREQVAAFLKDAGSIESGAAALSELVRLATQRVVQEALEQEQTDFVGRERYARQPGRGKRNGYIPGHLETAEGRLAIQVPQVREAGTPYRSALYDFLRGHSDVVERLLAWLQNFRRLVTRYEYHAANFLAFIQLGCIVILLRAFMR